MRKDLVRKVKVGANVPVFVLEYLLGKYCASCDEMAIQMGLQVVNDTLADNYIRPDESTKAQSRVKEQGHHTFIDKVKVRLVDSDYWAEVINFGHAYVHIPDSYVRDYDRLLTGGIWAQVDMRFENDEESRGQEPVLDRQAHADPARHLRPGGVPRACGPSSPRDEWLDLMVRSMGYEPAEMARRLKLLFLTRLVPLVRAQLQPGRARPAGHRQELRRPGALALRRAAHRPHHRRQPVRPHERPPEGHGADLGRGRLRRGRRPPEDAQGGHHHDEDLLRVRQFQRGQEAMAGYASIAMFGNTHQPVDVMVQTGHLFAPMPDVIRDDMAFIDRLHFYLPGWEMPKMRNEHFTDHYGFVVDYLAEALARAPQAQLHRGHRPPLLPGRPPQRPRPEGRAPHRLRADQDPPPARRGLAGRPGGDPRPRHRGPAPGQGAAQEDGLLRVLPDLLQLHRQRDRRGALRRRARAGRPRSHLRRSAAAWHRLHRRRSTATAPWVSIAWRSPLSSGTGKLKLAGGVSGTIKESVSRAFAYLQANKAALGVAREVDTSDFHVEVIDLLGNQVDAEIGVAFFVASLLRPAQSRPSPALLVLGDLSIQGNIKPVRSLVEPLQVAMDNGAQRALIPIENKRNFLEVSADVIEQRRPDLLRRPANGGVQGAGPDLNRSVSDSPRLGQTEGDSARSRIA